MIKICKDIIPVYEFRPILESDRGEVFRYNEGEWLLDDGEYDIAFAHPSDCMAYGLSVPSYSELLWSWVKNGNWGAFVAGHPRGNAWHYMLRNGETEWAKSWDTRNHLNEKAKDEAMNFVCHRTHCSNGVGPEFHINDPYIEQGLLRLRDTKEIVKFPEIFNCMYCGEIDWREAEREAENDNS